MKKDLLSLCICIGLIFSGCSVEAAMKTQSLSMGGDSDDSSTIQTVLKSQIEPVAEETPVPVEVNETNINYINVSPYYSPYYNPYVQTYTVGPYGVYSNIGGFSFSYTGHGFNYGAGINRPIYVRHPAPPPPPGGGAHGPLGPHGPRR